MNHETTQSFLDTAKTLNPNFLLKESFKSSAYSAKVKALLLELMSNGEIELEYLRLYDTYNLYYTDTKTGYTASIIGIKNDLAQSFALLVEQIINHLAKVRTSKL